MFVFFEALSCMDSHEIPVSVELDLLRIRLSSLRTMVKSNGWLQLVLFIFCNTDRFVSHVTCSIWRNLCSNLAHLKIAKWNGISIFNSMRYRDVEKRPNSLLMCKDMVKCEYNQLLCWKVVFHCHTMCLLNIHYLKPDRHRFDNELYSMRVVLKIKQWPHFGGHCFQMLPQSCCFHCFWRFSSVTRHSQGSIHSTYRGILL